MKKKNNSLKQIIESELSRDELYSTKTNTTVRKLEILVIEGALSLGCKIIALTNMVYDCASFLNDEIFNTEHDCIQTFKLRQRRKSLCL